MKIYIFNPEHDIALASNLEHFTAPHAGRELRHDLGFLPALWAEREAFVLVDDVEAAKEGLRRTGFATSAKFIDKKDFKDVLVDTDEKIDIKPWGWNLALRQSLKAIGVNTKLLPDNGSLNIMRQISHRAWAAEHLLPYLLSVDGTVGEAKSLQSIDEVRQYLGLYHNIVLKAPWSSSGRGIRYISDAKRKNGETYYGITRQLEGWINNNILRQGCVMGEPLYNKVSDFGMEFIANDQGIVEYKGLSVFHTVNGEYVGNIIEDEEHKEAMLTKYIPQSVLVSVRLKVAEILSEAFKGTYVGPFGIDMMVARTENGMKVNPCVELNLRMTMGHVALLLNRKLHIEQSVMRINYMNGRYGLTIS